MGRRCPETYPASLLHHISGVALRDPTVLQRLIDVNALPPLLEEKVAEAIVLGQRHGWKASNLLQRFPSEQKAGTAAVSGACCPPQRIRDTILEFQGLKERIIVGHIVEILRQVSGNSVSEARPRLQYSLAGGTPWRSLGLTELPGVMFGALDAQEVSAFSSASQGFHS